MKYKMFLDDERYPTTPDWMIARTSYDAIYFVTNFGIPYEVAFDHDLGVQDTAMVFIKWLENKLLDNQVSLPYNFTYSVHSANPIGAENIKCHMNNIIEYFKEN